MSLLLVLAALLAGVANPFQSGVNAELNKQLMNPLWASIFVYGSGLLTVCLLQLCFRQFMPMQRIGEVSWWAWLGGLISVVSTMVALTIAQKLGSGIFTGLSITASLVTSVALDHFGLIGFRQHTASPARLVGCTLMVVGVWIVSRF